MRGRVPAAAAGGQLLYRAAQENLATWREEAAEMKGRLSCTSPGRGQGATFTLELPMVDEETSS